MSNIKLICISIIFMLLVGTLVAQSVLMDINSSTRSISAMDASDPIFMGRFTSGEMVKANGEPRYKAVRSFDFNRQLTQINAQNIGDRISLSFFDDHVYVGEIMNVIISDKESTVITAKIEVEDPHLALTSQHSTIVTSYAIITVTDDNITIAAKIPDQDDFFFAATKGGVSHIGQMSYAEYLNDRLPGSDLMIEEYESTSPTPVTRNPKRRHPNRPPLRLHTSCSIMGTGCCICI